jgi:protein SCO1
MTKRTAGNGGQSNRTRTDGRGRALTWRSACVVAALAWAAPGFAQPTGPLSVPPPGQAAVDQIPILREVGIDQKLDNPVPLDLEFTDENGKTVKLGDYFGSRPVVLALVYYECPMLCTQVLNGLVGSLEALTFDAGRDYDVVVVSFDPGETPALATEKRKTYLTRYGRPGTEVGVHFLTGRQEAITALTQAVGFRYAYDAEIDQFAHPAAITVLTPAGHVSRYLYGIEFAPRDLRLALVEATDGKIGTAVDQALLFCYHYDPQTGKYGFVIMNVIRLGGVLTLAGLGAFILLNLRRERRQDGAVAKTATGNR